MQALAPALITRMRQHLQAGNQVILFLNRRALPRHCCVTTAAGSCRNAALRPLLHLPSGPAPFALPLRQPAPGAASVPVIAGQRTSCRSVWALNNWNRPRSRSSRMCPCISESTGTPPAVRGAGTAAGRSASRWRAHPDWRRCWPKGHHFPDVTLVALLDVDGALFSADFRSAERFAQLYTRWPDARRAGKQGRSGTANAILSIRCCKPCCTKAMMRFAEQALAERQTMQLPRGPAT